MDQHDKALAIEVKQGVVWLKHYVQTWVDKKQGGEAWGNVIKNEAMCWSTE